MSQTEPAGAGEAPAPKIDKQRVAASFDAAPDVLGRLSFTPRNFNEVWLLADLFSQAGSMVPEIYRENRPACAMAIMWGLELGISPIQAIQGIAVIGGRAGVWGDLQHALVVSHPDFEWIKERFEENEAGDVVNAICVVKRKDKEPIEQSFSFDDAVRAGLAGKDTYKKYRRRMLQMRARSWAERDALPEALRGLAPAEELIDVTPERASTRRGQEAQESIPEPRALEHEPNPLNDPTNYRPEVLDDLTQDADRVAAASGQSSAVDFSDMDDLDQAEVREDARQQRVRNATPQHDLLSGGSGGNGSSSQEGGPSSHGRGGLSQRTTAKRASTPTSSGQRKLLDSMLAGAAVTEQDVRDELGDDITAENFERALAWITAKAGESST